MLNTFIKADGQVTRCPNFMAGPPLKAGYWWHSTQDKTYIECPMPVALDVNDTRLFGYTEREFLAKQYR